MIVPEAMGPQTTFHGIHPNLKHISVMTDISSAGKQMGDFSLVPI
jgi:hypothetical protein